MKQLLLLCIIVCGALCAHAQHKPDSIQQPGFGRWRYRLHGKELTLSQLWDTTSRNPIAMTEAKKARNCYYGYLVTGTVGLVCIIYVFVGVIKQQPLNVGVAVTGAATSLISIPLGFGARNHTLKAVATYNSLLQ